MDIKELESFRLADAVKFHDKLNPALWTEKGELDPEVYERLMDIAKDFMAYLGLSSLKVEDITISGSNAAYSYTPHSDLDLHILVDHSKLPDDEVYKELFNAKKTIYNDTHDIKVHGVPVELYVQDSNQPHHSLGEYSVLKKDWIKMPVKRRANFDQSATKAKYEKLGELLELAIKTRSLKRVDKVLDIIKRYRKAGLEKTGEFGPENLAFKALRKQGLIQKLWDLRNELRSEKLSLEDYDPNGPPPGPEFPPTMPAGTVRVDVSDVYDWYKLGQHISNMKGLGKHDFGKGPPSTILSFGDEDLEHQYIQALKKTGLDTTDIDPVDPKQPKGMPRQKVDPTYNVGEARSNPEQNVKEESGKKELLSIAKTISDPENWAISMTSQPKLGVNPQPAVSEDTPKGIYFYPLDYALGEIKRNKPLPWGDNMPYIQLFQYDRSNQMTEQTKVDSAKLKQALSKYCTPEIMQQAEEEGDYDGTPYWYIYDCLSRLNKGDETTIIRWNKVLRELGFTSVFDPGNGWIAYNEPTQGVVLDPRIIKQHKTIANRKESKVVTPARIAQWLFDEIDMELTSNRIWQKYDPDGSKVRQKCKEYAAGPDFKPFIGKPFSQELENKIKSYRTFGARELSDIAMDWYKAQQQVNEAFDQPYRLKWEKSDYGDVDAYAKMDDGTYLSIMFNKGFSQGTKEEAWNVEFYRNNSQEVTGEGDAQRVFATVLSALKTFIKKYKPNRVIFSASKDNWAKQQQNSESRASLYDRLVQRYARVWGFRAFRADTGDKVIYELSRIKKDVAEDYKKVEGGWHHYGLGYGGRREGIQPLPRYNQFTTMNRHKEGTASDIYHYMRFLSSKDFMQDVDITGEEIANALAKLGGTNPKTELQNFNKEHDTQLKSWNRLWDFVIKKNMDDHRSEMLRLESASGYIPSNKEKNDPRFKTALTVDVKPDSIMKNAKAFGNKVSRAGIPPQAKTNGKF